MLKKLATLREAKGYTQRQLAKAIGVGPSTIAMYETGRRVPSLPVARRIARCFGESVDAIVFDAEAHIA